MGNRELNMVQCGAPKIAKLVYKCRISIGFMVLISIVRWGYKPTYRYRESHIVYKDDIVIALYVCMYIYIYGGFNKWGGTSRSSIYIDGI